MINRGCGPDACRRAGRAAPRLRPRSFDFRSLFSLAADGCRAVAGSRRPNRRSQPPREWSGESGASGHPLMQAAAIRAAAANFRNCLEGIWPLAQRRNVPRAVFDKLLAGVTPDLRIMDLLDSQPEFTKAVWEYLDILVTDARIADGRAMLAKHRAAFDTMEKAYGVDRHIIAAIWGVELNYGTQIGDRSVIRSTATLACIGRRQDFFRDELLAALEIVARGDVRAEHLRRLLGRRVRADAIHADDLQALRGRCRRRRPARRRASRCPISSRRPRTISSATAGRAARPGATRSSCRAASISCSPTAAR